MNLVTRVREEKDARRERLLRALKALLKQLRGMGALQIWLFGSLARDEVDTHSDLDLLVVMPSSQSSREWTEALYKNLDIPLALDLLVFNEEDFSRDLPYNPLLQEITRAGKRML